MGGRSLDSWLVDNWPCLFLVSAASHLLSKTCSVVKWAVIDVNVPYLLDVTSMLLPEYRAYKTLPAQRACSPSNELTNPSLLNERAPWALSLQNPPCSMSLLPKHRTYKTLPVWRASRLQNPPFLTSMLPEHQSYNTLPAQWACSLSVKLTKPSLFDEHRA